MAFKKLISSHWPAVAIIFAAAILRFWRLEALTTFAADQGYDFLIVKRMLVDGKFTLLGPKIGPYDQIGNLYLGPAYYYLIAPFLLIFNFDPIGPAVLTVLLSILTIFVIYLICVKFINKTTAILASSLYAFNVELIDQSRAPSNPHLIPFFASIFIFSLLCLPIGNKSKGGFFLKQTIIWSSVAGFALGIMFQLHYLASSLIFPLIIILVLNKSLKKILLIGFSFLLAISPQVIFELRHKFFITNLILKHFQSGTSISTLDRFSDHFLQSQKTLIFVFTHIDKYLALTVLILIILVSLFVFKFKKTRQPILLLTLTVIFGLIFASLYSGSVGLHYFATIYPSIVILIAVAASYILIFLKSLTLKTVFILAIFQFFAINFLNLNLSRKEGYTMPKGWNLPGVKKVSQIIAGDVEKSTKFNIAATLDGDTRARPYRYLVEIIGKTPQQVEQYPFSDVNYLITRGDQNSIKSYTVWEVSSFRPFEIISTWEIQDDIKLYKLVHAKTD